MLQKVGDTYNNFEIIKAVYISELQCHLYELIHVPTNAQIMHIANDDPENVFCLSFRTLPENSHGTAHVLEHTVLCGSEKFPVKDPFFAMTRRSLNTYMNALTGSDFTCYPAASQVPKDFYNLLEVYLDAVFKPNLKELSFLQEGHRLEFAIPNDPSSPLERKGIVYNEMKGDMSSPSSRLTEAINRALFPDITYGHNSGGDPSSIPNLTYKELLEFHTKYYQPSRCLFYFYGNLPLESHLDFIATHVLNEARKLDPLPPIPKQPRFTNPIKIQEPYPISFDTEAKDKALIGFGWLTSDVLDQAQALALSVLEIILMDTDASPLKLALLKSGLCKQAGCYLESDASEIPFVITVKGCQPEHADAIEKTIFDVLLHFSKEEIPLDAVKNALHQLEFFRSEILGDHSPFGLSLFMRSGLLKQHGANPEEGLCIHTLFEKLHKDIIENPLYFAALIDKHLLNNPHFVRVLMIPDKDQAAKELAADRMDLDNIRQELTEEDVSTILKKTQELADFQEEQEEEDLDLLPKISLDDIPQKNKIYSLSQLTMDNLEIFHHDCFTNGIVYADLTFDMPFVKEEDLFYVRLFTLLASQIGSGKRNYAQNLEYLQANTGGLDAGVSLNLQAKDHHQFYPYFLFRGKALYRKSKELFELLHDMTTSLDFTDIPRMKEIIMKHHTGLENSLAQNSMRYAINLSASGISIASKIADYWYGLGYFWKIRDIANNFDAYANEIVGKLQELQAHLMCVGTPHLVLSCDSTMFEELKRHRFYGLTELKPKFFSPWSHAHYQLKPVHSQSRLIASPVAFIGKVIPTVSYIHEDSPSLDVAAGLFDNMTLHKKIREQGGAYGAGAVSNRVSGNFYFYSYRDPNIISTLDAFDESIQDVLKGNFDEEDLHEAKLEIIQSMDAPVAPGSRASLAYNWMREGKDQILRQEYRERLMSLTHDDVLKAVKQHIVPNFEKGSAVIFSGKDLLDKENETLKAVGKSPFPIEPI